MPTYLLYMDYSSDKEPKDYLNELYSCLGEKQSICGESASEN